VRTLGLISNALGLLRLNRALVVAFLKFGINRMPLGIQAVHLIVLIEVILTEWTSVEQILQNLISSAAQMILRLL
jgi:hypothetical protein